MFFNSTKSKITVNGKSYQGNSVKISNNKVYIDGKLQNTEEAKEISISVVGNIKKLDVDSCDRVGVIGDVETLKTMSGDVDVEGNVSGSVKTMSGNVDCENVGGNISTMSGNIKHKK